MLALRLTLPLLAAGLCLQPLARPAASSGSRVIALKAGTIHVVENDEVIEGGGVLLIQDGRVLAVGANLAVPPGAQVIDYGSSAVLMPGLVAANSPYALGRPSDRAAEPGLDALDGFDFYGAYALDLSAGVTSAYITPAQGRLIAGRGAVVKLSGDDPARRVVRAPAALHGSIAKEARSTPGYWRPPVPATVDVGLGMAEPQRPKSTMGAIYALGELVTAARAGTEAAGFGPYAAAELADVLASGMPWRLRAGEEFEVRSLIEFAQAERLPLLLELVSGPALGAEVTALLAASGFGVIIEMPYAPNQAGRSLGDSADARWPNYDVAAGLSRAGVPIAFSTPDTPRNLRFAAALGQRGGLDAAAALRAITLTPARMLGVADRVGSLSPGKDADVVVLNGPPLSVSSSVLATWIDGRASWHAGDAAGVKAGKSHGASGGGFSAHGPVVLSVDELHVGDGTVIAPAQILMQNGRIVEIGRSVSKPAGATLVSGHVAMPGMIDALGHLGLDNSRKVPSTDFKLTRIVAPGDHVDRKVAAAGVTTVVMSPRGSSNSGAPLMAYKPAAEDIGMQVISDPSALRLSWTDRDRAKSGDDVRELLAKAADYTQKWKEYEAELAAWTPPPPEPAKDDAEADKEEDGDEKKDKADEPAKEDDKDKKKKKKKKDEEEVVDPDPVTGVWTAALVVPPREEEAPLRMQLRLQDGNVSGFLRCAALSQALTAVEGTYERSEDGEQRLSLSGLGLSGYFALEGLIEEAELKGTVKTGAAEIELTAKRESREYPVAKRTERRKDKTESPKPPKGSPKEPKRDDRLEPLRQAILNGSVAVVVEVERSDEIVACVDAFANVGIKPVLFGASDAHEVLDKLRGRVAGVLLSHEVIEVKAKTGAAVRNRYAELQSAGIRVAFHSEAEEGAADLPLMAAYAVSEGMSATGALRALTSDAAEMMAIGDHVGTLRAGKDADVLLLDGSPLEVSTRVLRVWVNGTEVR